MIVCEAGGGNTGSNWFGCTITALLFTLFTYKQYMVYQNIVHILAVRNFVCVEH